MSLSTLILLALGLGALFGTFLNGWLPIAIEPLDQYLLHPLGQAFLRLIQFVVVPIVFSSIVLGCTQTQNAAQVGRYVVKLLTSYAITSLLSLMLGLSTALILKPGVGIEDLRVVTTEVGQAPSVVDWLLSLIPINPLEALSSGNLLQVIVTAALFSIGMQLAQAESQPFLAWVKSVYSISEKILGIILYAAPIGVFALMSSVIASHGLGLMAKLLLYVLGLLLASLLMAGFYLGVLFILGAKPIKLLTSLAPSLSLAFGTASSNAVLPVLLRNIQENYGLRAEIAGLAIPLGTAIKRDGAAILQSFNALFIAQIYQVPVTPSLILSIALSSFLVSFSTPGVPGSALITMTTVLSASGLPLEGVAIVAGVDRLTDGFKTALNVVGNSTNAVILSYWEASSQDVAHPKDPSTETIAPM